MRRSDDEKYGRMDAYPEPVPVEDYPEEPERDDVDQPEQRERRPSRVGSLIMAFVTGSILSRAEVRKTYPYLLFVAFLAFLYIGNIFGMQRLHRRHDNLTKQVNELRAKSMTIASQKMNATRQSNIIREIERRGLPLEESLTPNKVIPK